MKYRRFIRRPPVQDFFVDINKCNGKCKKCEFRFACFTLDKDEIFNTEDYVKWMDVPTSVL